MKNYNITVNGKLYSVSVEDAPAPKAAASKTAQSESIVTSPLVGSVMSVKVKAGDKVKEGDVMLTLAASNVETEILAPLSGTIVKVSVAVGSVVNAGDALVVF